MMLFLFFRRFMLSLPLFLTQSCFCCCWWQKREEAESMNFPPGPVFVIPLFLFTVSWSCLEKRKIGLKSQVKKRLQLEVGLSSFLHTHCSLWDAVSVAVEDVVVKEEASTSATTFIPASSYFVSFSLLHSLLLFVLTIFFEAKGVTYSFLLICLSGKLPWMIPKWTILKWMIRVRILFTAWYANCSFIPFHLILYSSSPSSWCACDHQTEGQRQLNLSHEELHHRRYHHNICGFFDCSCSCGHQYITLIISFPAIDRITFTIFVILFF